MARSIFILIVCIAAIGGAVFHLVSRPQSAAEREREVAGWRICAECGHRWHMPIADMAAQLKQNPDGIGAVQCPQCHAWRGMARAECPTCGEPFPSDVLIETGDGLRIEKQRTCPHCGYVFGSEAATEDAADE